MQGSDEAGRSSDEIRCALCRHSVPVRGRDQRVCMVFLSILGAQNNDTCREFEGKENPRAAASGE
jgi:hypothetical protein